MAVHRRVRGELRVAGQAMKETYDKRMREAKYSTGDRVWLYNTRRKRGLSPKLQSPWEGPYTVVAALSTKAGNAPLSSTSTGRGATTAQGTTRGAEERLRRKSALAVTVRTTPR